MIIRRRTTDSVDCNFITNRVATGGAIFYSEQIEALEKLGITHIINCRIEFDDSTVFPIDSKMNYLWAGVEDDGNAKHEDWFNKIIKFALDALAKPNNKIFAHCFAGINRGPSAAYAILRAQGFTADMAEDMIVKVRPIVELYYKYDADYAIKSLGYE